ncbi:hypothetical protein NDU88_002937 [Pleurodeles waltl]|uniref:Uncharacterized protein n=1 Tax=Pleurodeles waltl TaxID=8319 RepID=A0AAV7MQC6_PLEWA|nr:hypothetical protein NDU88_002937 [Pleurodeles waltl]
MDWSRDCGERRGERGAGRRTRLSAARKLEHSPGGDKQDVCCTHKSGTPNGYTWHDSSSEIAEGDESGASPEEDTAPITKVFLEWLFEVLHNDFATFKQEIAADVKDLEREMAEVGHSRTHPQGPGRGDRPAQVGDRDLQGSNRDLQYRLEDIEKAIIGNLEDFMICLFHHVTPELKEQDILLDRTHRAGRPAQSPGQAQDILTCLHYYHQREAILPSWQKQRPKDG